MSIEHTARGIGPFSSGHLTVIAVAIVLAVAFPLAAAAVSGSNAFVTDATTGKHAAVNSDGRLATVVGYPTRAIVTSGDAVASNTCTLPTDVCPVLIKPPAGQALVVTSIHVDVAVLTAPTLARFVEVFRSSDQSCKVNKREASIDWVHPATVGMTVLEYPLPGGVPVRAGKALCLKTYDSANLIAVATAYGYWVPSGSVP